VNMHFKNILEAAFDHNSDVIDLIPVPVSCVLFLQFHEWVIIQHGTFIKDIIVGDN